MFKEGQNVLSKKHGRGKVVSVGASFVTAVEFENGAYETYMQYGTGISNPEDFIEAKVML